jgi:hypothetical protein
VRTSVRVNTGYPADDPKSRALMERKAIDHRKSYQTHGEDLHQIGIPGGWPVSKAICLTSVVGRSRRVNQDPAVRGVRNASSGRQ